MTAPASPSTTTLTRRDALRALGLAGVMGLCSFFLIVPDVCGTYHDDGVYVITAKSLAQGHGYRLLHLPGQPRQTKYPPLFPAALAFLWYLYPDYPANLKMLLIVPFLCGMATVALSYLYLVRFGYTSRSVAALAVLWCATAPVYGLFSTLAMAEFPFALLWLVAQWQLERMPGEKGRWWSQVLLGVVCGLPSLCRTVGFALVPAAFWICWRQKRSLPWVLLGMAIALGPWLVWAKTGWGGWEQQPVVGYYTDYLGWWQQASPSQLVDVVKQNAVGITWQMAGNPVQGLTQFLVTQWPMFGWLFMILGICGLVMLVRWGIQGRVLPMCVGASLLLMCVWPWPPARFLVPILPLLAAAALTPLATIVSARLQKISPVLGGLLLTLTVLPNLWLWRATMIQTREAHLPPLSFEGKNPSWQTQTELLTWLVAHMAPEDIVVAELDPLLYLHAGKTASRPFAHRPLSLYYGQPGPPLGTVAQWREQMLQLRPRFLVTVSLPSYAENKPFLEMVETIKREHPTWLSLKYQAPSDPQAAIYAVDLDRMAADK